MYYFDKKLKEIENFLELESSLIERGKRYKEDTLVLLKVINDLNLHISNIKPISTSDISKERALFLLERILALVEQFKNEPAGPY